MAPEALAFIEASTELGRREAEAHYAALYEVYLNCVAEFLRPQNQIDRPLGFNADTNQLAFPLLLGERFVLTLAVFEFAGGTWAFSNYLSQTFLGVIGFGGLQQIATKNLPAAILTASELWKATQAIAQASNPPLPNGSEMLQ